LNSFFKFLLEIFKENCSQLIQKSRIDFTFQSNLKSFRQKINEVLLRARYQICSSKSNWKCQTNESLKVFSEPVGRKLFNGQNSFIDYVQIKLYAYRQVAILNDIVKLYQRKNCWSNFWRSKTFGHSHYTLKYFLKWFFGFFSVWNFYFDNYRWNIWFNGS